MKNTENNTTTLSTGLALDFSKRVYIFDDKSLPEGWRVLRSSGVNLQNKADSNGFKGMVFINDATKQVVVACGGTNASVGSMDDLRDLIADASDDFRLATGRVPTQFIKGAVPLTEAALQQMEAPRDYTWTTVGHSLGAVLAELLAKQIGMEGISVESKTFDSPGSKSLAGIVTGGMETELYPVTIYNSNPNAVNTTNAHLGEAEVHCVRMEDHSNIVLKGMYSAITTVSGAFSWCLSGLKSALSYVAPVTNYVPGLQTVLSPQLWVVDGTLSTMIATPVAIAKLLAKAVQTLDQHGLARFVELYDPENDCFRDDIIVESDSWPNMTDMLTGKAMDYDPTNHDASWEMLNITDSHDDACTLVDCYINFYGAEAGESQMGAVALPEGSCWVENYSQSLDAQLLGCCDASVVLCG
jgi:hypothetical protein